MRAAGADGATGAAEAHEGEEDPGDEGREQEPEEDGAGLDLAAALLVVGGAEADPAGAELLLVEVAAAVGGLELGGEDDAGDEGEEGGGAVEGHQRDGDGDALDEGGDEAVEHGEPRQHGDEHGEVDGGLMAVDVGCVFNYLNFRFFSFFLQLILYLITPTLYFFFYLFEV